MVRPGFYQIHSYSIWHPLKHSFGADCITLLERLRDFDPGHKEALTFFYFRQQIVSINQATMFARSMLKLCFSFVIGIILLTSRISATPLNKFVSAPARGTETSYTNNN